MMAVQDFVAGVVVCAILINVVYLVRRLWDGLRGARRRGAPRELLDSWLERILKGDRYIIAYISALRENYEAGRQAPEAVAYGFLVERLTPDQREDFDRTGGFWVLGSKSKTHYRISFGNVPNIGTKQAVYCASIGYGWPDCDDLLAQKTMIELDERAFLRRANVYREGTIFY